MHSGWRKGFSNSSELRTPRVRAKGMAIRGGYEKCVEENRHQERKRERKREARKGETRQEGADN